MCPTTRRPRTLHLSNRSLPRLALDLRLRPRLRQGLLPTRLHVPQSEALIHTRILGSLAVEVAPIVRAVVTNGIDNHAVGGLRVEERLAIERVERDLLDELRLQRLERVRPPVVLHPVALDRDEDHQGADLR